MTPEEKSVIEAAMAGNGIGSVPTTAQGHVLREAVHALIFACSECNAGGHTCPGDGNPIGHTQTDCGQHEESNHAGADGACPDYGNTLDPCPPGCASGVCVESARRCIAEHDPLAPCEWCSMPATSEWIPATLVQCLAGDRIRIGTDETDVIRTDGGRVWHADNTDAYHPKPWKHIELRMELAANPGFQEYPPNTPCEILCTPERKASLLLQSAFPGSAVTSSDVD